MVRLRKPILLVLLALSLVALYQRSAIQAWATSSTPGKGVGQDAPDLPAGTQSLAGAPVRLGELRGQVVLLHFWTFACGNCEHMMPSYRAWDARWRSQGLRVIGVHTPELEHERNLDALRAFVNKSAIAWTVVPDRGETIWDSFGVHAWPTVFVIDRAGKIRGTFVGDDRSRDIEALLRRLIES